MSVLVLALVSGAVVGLALGGLGGGGSMLAVPALIYGLGFTPADATTAGLLIVAATSASALYAHARAGHVRWRAGGLFAAAGIPPAAAAGAVAGHLPQATLTAAFAAVAALAAALMLRPRGALGEGTATSGTASGAVGSGTGSGVEGFTRAAGSEVGRPARAAGAGSTESAEPSGNVRPDCPTEGPSAGGVGDVGSGRPSVHAHLRRV
ncbi:TSUP family transporter, partial [Streptomyces sp. NPDC059063]|uniref:TSUP family transporter n=1 Tax=Streptomyces sp. NPDC059063 TaxID=3346712 RepID=UPI0036BE15C7